MNGNVQRKKEIYPLTVTSDRYGGAYSGGKYIAWNLRVYDVPIDPFLDDVTCASFWYSCCENNCAVGETIEEAVENLRKKLQVSDPPEAE